MNMTLEKTCGELKKLMARWELKTDEWALFLHYCCIFEGYHIRYGRDKHLHIIISSDKIPWPMKITKNDLDNEITIPANTKYEKGFNEFIRATKHDFHIMITAPSFFDRLIKKYSFIQKLPGQEKMRVINIIGNLLWYELTLPREIKRFSPEVIARRLLWFEELIREAKKKKDRKIDRLASKLLKKYRPKDKALFDNRSASLDFFRKNGLIKGEIGYRGKVREKIFYIANPDTAPKSIKKGVVLLAKFTSPKLFNQIKYSKAVITDEGGRLSHAAVICREFKIPCIVGAKIATEVLKNGDLVEVDANKGLIKKINKKSIYS